MSVYLYPCAVPGSHKYRLNCQVLSWAHELICNIHGLVCLCGDLNAPLDSFDMCRHIIAEGWQDMALACHRRFGCPLLPTCKSATRHTYGVGNPRLGRFRTRHMHTRCSFSLWKFRVLIKGFGSGFRFNLLLWMIAPLTWRISTPKLMLFAHTISGSVRQGGCRHSCVRL